MTKESEVKTKKQYPEGTPETLILPIFFPTCKKKPKNASDRADNRSGNGPDDEELVDADDFADEDGVVSSEADKGKKKDNTPACACAICELARCNRRSVRNVLKLYRHTIRKVAAITCLSHIASAECVDRLNAKGEAEVSVVAQRSPVLDAQGEMVEDKEGYVIDQPNSKVLLEAAFGAQGKKYAYALRDYIRDAFSELNFYSITSDQAIDDVNTAIFALDPIAGASRVSMIMNAVSRRPPLFRNRGFPLRADQLKIQNHSISFSLQKGVWLDAKIGKIKDGSRWGILKKLMTDEWKMGSIIRVDIGDPSRKDGKLRSGEMRLYITYYRPFRKNSTCDMKRVLEAGFSGEREKMVQFCILKGGKSILDKLRNDFLGADGAIAYVDRIKKQTEKYQRRLASCGSYSERRRGCGNSSAYSAEAKRLSRITRARESGCKSWNHRWSSYIVNLALKWDCSEIAVMNLPEDLFKRPWQWSNFVFFLEYKARNRGIKVHVVEPEEKKEDEKQKEQENSTGRSQAGTPSTNEGE